MLQKTSGRYYESRYTAFVGVKLLRLVPSHVWRYVQFAEGAEPFWSDAVKKWENILEAKNLALTESSIYAPYLTVEVQSIKSPPFGT